MRRRVWVSRIGIGAAVMLILSACGSSAAPSRAPASPTTTAATAAAATGAATGGTADTTADSIARQWLTALQAKDLEAMASLWAPDGVWEDGATGESFSGGPGAETSGWGVALGMVVSVNQPTVLALGDGVAVVAYTLHGPTPAHSTAIDVPIIGVLHVRDSRVTRETIYYNPRLAYGS